MFTLSVTVSTQIKGGSRILGIPVRGREPEKKGTPKIKRTERHFLTYNRPPQMSKKAQNILWPIIKARIVKRNDLLI